MIEPSLPILLTGFDIIFLSDALRNGDTIKSEEDELPYLRQLVLLLASVYNEAISKEDLTKEYEIYVTKSMCWLMRAKVHTGDIAIDGKTNIGVPLLKELHEKMIKFASEISDLETSPYESPILSEENKADLKEQRYARWSPDEDNYPSRSPSC